MRVQRILRSQHLLAKLRFLANCESIPERRFFFLGHFCELRIDSWAMNFFYFCDLRIDSWTTDFFRSFLANCESIPGRRTLDFLSRLSFTLFCLVLQREDNCWSSTWRSSLIFNVNIYNQQVPRKLTNANILRNRHLFATNKYWYEQTDKRKYIPLQYVQKRFHARSAWIFFFLRFANANLTEQFIYFSCVCECKSDRAIF